MAKNRLKLPSLIIRLKCVPHISTSINFSISIQTTLLSLMFLHDSDFEAVTLDEAVSKITNRFGWKLILRSGVMTSYKTLIAYHTKCVSSSLRDLLCIICWDFCKKRVQGELEAIWSAGLWNFDGLLIKFSRIFLFCFDAQFERFLRLF